MRRVIQPAVAGIVTLLGLALTFPSPGCRGKEGGVRTRLDTLKTDRERLLIIYDLPPGLAYDDARLRLPTLGPLTPVAGGHGDHEATAPIEVFGRPATLALAFGEHGLTRCAYRIENADSLSSVLLYREIQVVYTMEFGNYHEEWHNDAGGGFSRSFWSSAALGVTLTMYSGAVGYRLEWWCEPLQNITRETV